MWCRSLNSLLNSCTLWSLTTLTDSGPRLEMNLTCEAVFDSASATYNITGIFTVPPLISESIIGFDAKRTRLLLDAHFPVSLGTLRVNAMVRQHHFKALNCLYPYVNTDVLVLPSQPMAHHHFSFYITITLQSALTCCPVLVLKMEFHRLMV